MVKVIKFQKKEGTKYLQEGLIRVSKTNPEFGSIMVQESASKITNGFLNAKPRFGFIRGYIKDLLNASFEENQKLDCKVLIKECVSSEIGDDLGYRIKMQGISEEERKAGKLPTNACGIKYQDGSKELVHWKTVVVESSSNDTDTTIEHNFFADADEIAEIKAIYATEEVAALNGDL